MSERLILHEFDLHAYPRIVNWLERVKGQPGYIPMSA
jgi:hypothetical protein